MNTKGRLLIALVELGGAMWITYQQLPADQRQRVRMTIYRQGMKACERTAFKVGQLGIRIEQKYGEEASTNG